MVQIKNIFEDPKFADHRAPMSTTVAFVAGVISAMIAGVALALAVLAIIVIL